MRALAVALGLVLIASACSDDGSDDSASEGDDTTTTQAPREVAGPAADLSEELSGGGGVFVASPDAVGDDGTYQHSFDEPGYVEEEFAAAGTATSYTSLGDLPENGEWDLNEADTADYRTRIVVRRPAEAEDFSGVVVAEWFNVSAGVDADPSWTSTREEIVRQGHAWVGVSAQVIGVEGGPVRVEVNVPGADVAGDGLKTIDPERYGSLEHPGDAFSFDMYSQIATALRAGDALGELEPTTVVAAGQSQSAAALVTYHNGFQPVSNAFDGFLVFSRGASGLPLPAPGEAVDITGTIGRTPAIFRTDLDVPVMNLQAEGDITSFLASAAARQDDNEDFRLWELVGSSHADLHLVGENTVAFVDCGVPVNNGAMHVVAKATMRSLVDWILQGDEPPSADLVEISDGEEPEIQRDSDGIALGGLRTPPVDVPTKVLSSEPGPSSETICLMLGSTRPLPQERLAELYTSPADFEEQYAQAVEESIEAGFVLEDDREAIEAFADPSVVPS